MNSVPGMWNGSGSVPGPSDKQMINRLSIGSLLLCNHIATWSDNLTQWRKICASGSFTKSMVPVVQMAKFVVLFGLN